MAFLEELAEYGDHAVVRPEDEYGLADIVCDASAGIVRLERGQTIIEALPAAGVTVPTSCEEGICGTCETTVLRGSVAHRDAILSEEERAAGDVA